LESSAQAARLRRVDRAHGHAALHDVSSGLGIWSGARPTSRAQPAICPVSSARSNAASSTRLPREALMKTAVAFIAVNAAAFIRFSVSGVAGARHTTKSASASRVLMPTCRSIAVGTLACGSVTTTRMPNASARSTR
jgi:hypothetical protein